MAFVEDKPDTIKTTAFKEWFKIKFLSNHLKRFNSSEKTLDIGCGWGFSFKINSNFFGIEGDEACVLYNASLGRQVKLGNILEPLPFESGSFDNAFTHDVLEHLEIEEVKNLFLNVSKILKKGGIFLNVVPNKRGFDYGIEINAGHKTFISLREIEEISHEAGFEILESYSSPFEGFLGEVFKHNKSVVVSIKK